MRKALLVSDNQVLNALYSVNLKVYTDVEVEVVESLDEASEILVEGCDFDLVIVQGIIGADEIGLAMSQHLHEESLELPLICIGKQADVIDEVHILEGSFDVKELVRTIAKIFGITAKEMAEKEVPEYFPIHIKLFHNLKTVPCDVFFQKDQESSYFSIFEKDGEVWPKIKSYLDEGVDTLYISSSDRLAFTNLASGVILNELTNPDLTSDEKLDVVEQGVKLVAQKIFESGEMTDEIVEISSSCMNAIKDVVSDTPDLKRLLKLLVKNKSGYLYSHAIISTFISTLIIKNISWGGDTHIEKLNFVFFFHDMHLAPLYDKHPHLKFEEEALFDPALSDKEKDLLLSHAKLAAESIKTYPRCPIGADAIIRQHHGMTSGEGFAVKFRDDLSPLAKVMMIAETFTEEMIKVTDASGVINVDEIIAFLKDKFNRGSYSKILDVFEEIKF